MTETHTGSCLCGGVAYEVDGPLRAVWGCHCRQCRKTSGHHVAATAAPAEAHRLTAEETLRWYRSSAGAERGFCGRCGGNLFWRRVGGATISIFAGTLDAPTGLSLTRHIFARYKGDYYDLADGAGIFPESD
ncbi:GFA family protein [Pikeienuella piscinae]|uniref:GFA family protein n=1 Tax=Pikeienuella piscinae TaxID=2748098 RepID=A0A7L5BUX2_9RHOB|nr:GFA family protein [Pikeienuella piscinae]QIE56110.1 GFA family protein [Pikeienuella piscinae]